MRIFETTVAALARSPDAPSLFSAYAEETGIESIGGAKPNLDAYRKMQEAGFAHLFIAETDRLVGFCVLITSEHPHYSRTVAAIETIFCSNDGRKAGAGARLLIAAKRKASELGASVVLISAKEGSSLCSQLMRSKSAVPVQRIFEI